MPLNNRSKEQRDEETKKKDPGVVTSEHFTQLGLSLLIACHFSLPDFLSLSRSLSLVLPPLSPFLVSLLRLLPYPLSPSRCRLKTTKQKSHLPGCIVCSSSARACVCLFEGTWMCAGGRNYPPFLPVPIASVPRYCTNGRPCLLSSSHPRPSHPLHPPLPADRGPFLSFFN